MERICSSANLLVNFDDDDEHERREEDKLVKLPMWHGESARPLYSVSSKDLPSLRDTLTNKNWLVTPVYSTVNIKYVCQREEFDKKVVEHFQRTQAYVCIQERFTTCDMSVSHTLRTLVKLVQSELCRLLHQNKITCVQYRRLMRYHVEDNRLSSLIFVFDTHQVDARLRPCMSSGLPVLDNIAKYVHDILRPMYDSVTRSTTFNDGIDAVLAMETFANQGRLRSSTCFAVLEVAQLDIIFVHSKAIAALQHFLSEHAPPGTTSGLSHQTITFLVCLVLRTQYFAYNQHLCRQKRGGDSSSPLIRLLADIYLWNWQTELVNILMARYEVFGRCFNQMLLTWNDSPDQLHLLLDTIERQRPDLSIQRSVSCSVHYLNVNINHVDGLLRTRIHRSGWSEPLTVAFLKNLPMQYYETKIHSILVAAVQSSTHLDDFRLECDSLLHMCVLNGIPYNLIVDGVDCLCPEFQIWSAGPSEDKQAYQRLRQHLLAIRQTPSISANGKRSWSNDPGVHYSHQVSNAKRSRTVHDH